jgi:hypothetical protein
MKKKIVGFITFFVGTFLYVTTVQAQFNNFFPPFAPPDNDELLSGIYTFSTTGQGQLTEPIGPCDATGLVAAGLSAGLFIFDGNGRITGNSVGISIGTTSCTSPNYNVSGTYEVTDSDFDSFTATGKFTMTFVGRPAACAGTLLVEQPFTIIGNIPEETIEISTFGAGEGSSYAEAPPPGPTTCTATISNFITSGTGAKL